MAESEEPKCLLMKVKEESVNDIFSGNGIDTAAIESQDPTGTIIFLCVLMFIIGIAIFIPQLSAMVRRLHDVGKSGNILWLYLLCGIGGIIGLILCIPEGTPEPNKYGESPKFVRQQ